MLDRVRSKGDAGPAPLPPLASWSAEVDMGANIADAIKRLEDTLIRINTEKAKQNAIPAIHWIPRPGRPAPPDPNKLSEAQRREVHAKLVGKLLPKKAQSAD